MATPIDDKPYKCLQCPKRYKEKHTLNRDVLYNHKRDTISIEELTCHFCHHILIRRDDQKKLLKKVQFCSLLHSTNLLSKDIELSFQTEGQTTEVPISKSQ